MNITKTQILLIELDKLKKVYRRTYLADCSRNEIGIYLSLYLYFKM